ncbi:MAG TPA: hypothetical protein VKA46_18905 [Gemmataceae bacterium]|nr:hypothetical protein [Gemmataceae bacterium]
MSDQAESLKKLRNFYCGLPDAVVNSTTSAPALGVWQGYPVLAEILVSNVPDPDQRHELWGALNAAQYQAARKLMSLATAKASTLPASLALRRFASGCIAIATGCSSRILTGSLTPGRTVSATATAS